MKRIFIILCLMMICNVSYANIASKGYVDSVVAGKQDSIPDIATIRTGAGLGATAVQPSSLSTVATSGSYNDLSNKPTIPNIPTGPNDAKKYNLVWDGKTGQFAFQEMPREPLQCDASAGLYDIGFDQCVDSSRAAGGATDYDTFAMTWISHFEYGDVSGIASCNGEAGGIGVISDSAFEQSATGGNCWCKMTLPSESHWVWNYAVASSPFPADECRVECAWRCSSPPTNGAIFRSAMFGSVGN